MADSTASTSHSTVTAKAGYKFDKWTDEDQKSFDDDAALKAASYLEDQTLQHTLQQQSRIIG